MKESYRDLMEAFHMFHQLNFGSLLPHLTKGELVVLEGIASCRKKSCSHETKIQISNLVEELRILPPAVSRTLKGLEEKGYIVRSVNERDRRNTCVEITDAGREAMRESEQILNTFAERVFSKTSEEELRRVCAYLHQVYDTAREEIEQCKSNRKNRVKDGKED